MVLCREIISVQLEGSMRRGDGGGRVVGVQLRRIPWPQGSISSHIFLWCGDGGFDSELSWRNLVCCWESQWGEWCRKERCVGQEGHRVGASHLAKGDWRRSLALKM